MQDEGEVPPDLCEIDSTSTVGGNLAGIEGVVAKVEHSYIFKGGFVGPGSNGVAHGGSAVIGDSLEVALHDWHKDFGVEVLGRAIIVIELVS